MGEDRRYLLVSLVLAFVGGFADAGSYVVVRSFTGHITGTLLLTAVNVTSGHWPEAFSCFLAVVCFLAGTAGGVAWPHEPGRSACRHLAPVLVAELALVALGIITAVLVGTGMRDVFLACLCLALGLQNGALGKIGPVAFHTTFITGLSTTLVTALVAGQPGPKRRLLPTIILCFVCGAFCGAFLASRFGVAGFGVVFLLLTLIWAVAVTDPREAGSQGAPAAPANEARRA